MPVTTRSQFRAKSNTTFKALNTHVEETEYLWFINTVKKQTDLVEASIMTRNSLSIPCNNSSESAENKQLFINAHFDTLRLVTELMFVIGEYLPKIIKNYPKMIKFANAVVDKCNEFLRVLPSIHVEPNTAEEHGILSAFLNTLNITNDVMLTLIWNSTHLV